MIYYYYWSFKSNLKIFMKKLFFIFILIFLNIVITNASSDCENIADDFKKYECRSEKICKKYDENKKVFNFEKYKDAKTYKESESSVLVSSWLEDKVAKKVVSIYKENMNSIYKCAIIQVQKNSILNIKQKLLSLDKTWDIKKSFEPKVEDLINKLDMISKSSQCLNIDKQTIFNKLSILRQTTYLTCDYSFYMEYLKTYYSDPINILWLDKKQIEENNLDYATKDVANKIKNIQKKLDTEVNHAYKTFPIAFNAYSEYENNFPIHFLLELIKEDYNIFRNKLHEVLNPINQVVYKISNAMKK